MELKNLEAEGFLQPGSWRSVPDELAPAPRDDEMVLTKALVERGFSFPPSDFFLEILKTYGIQPHNISPNSVLAISNHVTLCEGHLRDVSDPASKKKLPPFKNCPATEIPAWSHCPHLSESPQLTRAVRRICKLTEEGLTGKDLTLSWFTKRIQPLQHRDRLMFQFTGRDDAMRATKDNLSADAIDKRIRLLIKIPRELHVHVCNKDIHTNDSGTALEALEENELGTLLRFLPPHCGYPEAEAEKKRLSLINTSNKGQPAIQHFFKPSGLHLPASRIRKTSSTLMTFLKIPPTMATPPRGPPHPFLRQISQAPLSREEQEQKAKLLQVTNATRVNLQPTPSLQKLTLAQRHAEVSAMLNKVWGKPDEEMRELADLEDSLKDFFAKHKEVRQQGDEARKELSEKHARDLAELNEKLEKSQGRVLSVISKNRVLEAEAEAIDKLIFPSLGFEWSKESNLKRTEAYDEARISIDALFEACRGIAKTLSLKKAKTTIIDTMTKLMQQVPDFIKDWQKSSARGAASLVLATCKAHFPSLNLADVARGAPEDSDMGALLAETEGYEQLFVRRVDHSFWYNKHDLPEGFSDAEEEAGEPEYYGEGSGSSGEHSGGNSGDDSEAGSGDSDDGSTYQQSEEEDSE
ncbi:hypothetical protein QYE76_071958 [Lolium multiflorum]|uniref:Transposase (putative) gypsy type domain-containing protein n=1 Tax=Lolium multiflorum TaxID=4521 RepID=A0AAD8PTX2_LOLMU|nr:hypothetical protein QYE76_071958 [Lolium multiflorum]